MLNSLRSGTALCAEGGVSTCLMVGWGRVTLDILLAYLARMSIKIFPIVLLPVGKLILDKRIYWKDQTNIRNATKEAVFNQ